MKNKLLLPYKCRLVGLVLAPLSLAHLSATFWFFRSPGSVGVLAKKVGTTVSFMIYSHWEQVAWIFIIVSLVMLAFSKLKVEDEYVQTVRLNSLLISIYINTAGFLLIILTMFYDRSFHLFLLYLFYSVVPLLLVFIVTFNYSLYIQLRLSKKILVIKKALLLPGKCRAIGMVLFPLSFALLYAQLFGMFRLPLVSKEVFIRTAAATKSIIYYDYTWQTAWILSVVSLVMVAFSKLKVEDEYVQAVRLNSLLFSIYIYIVGLLLIILTLFRNMFLVYFFNSAIPLLLLFIVMFNYSLYIKPHMSKSQAA